MATSVLLSIKPVYARQIFEGNKHYEFRKKLFKRTDVKKVIVYASAPISQVIGEFEIEDILYLAKDKLWDRTEAYSGISKAFFDEYFTHQSFAYAIKVGKTKLYDKPLRLFENFNIRYAPQSFVYLTRQLEEAALSQMSYLPSLNTYLPVSR